MSQKFIIALDQGTTSSRAVRFGESAKVLEVQQQEFQQYFPHPAWVEHDAEEIWQSQKNVLEKILDNDLVRAEQIVSIGITNQRETSIVWHRDTGKPIYRAIVWQDRRTAQRCDTLKAEGHERAIYEKTGLVLDAYFSATKIEWVLQNVEGAMALAEQGKLAFGTVDSWLIWNLTGGKVHATDASNASRTLLFNINTGEWDADLLDLFSIPPSMLPEVKDSADDFGLASIKGVNIPINGVAGDQQAALFGQTCFQAGMAKSTYGTGCFLLMNTGKQKVQSKHGLLTTIAWRLQGEMVYALEGSVFIGGAAVQWLRDGLQIIQEAKESEALAFSAANESEVVFVPAFTGLGAPHWDMYARGAIFGLTRDTGKAEITRATLDALAFQVNDVLEAMQNDSAITLRQLNVDGGAIANNYLAQMQADIIQRPVLRARVLESTALGAAYLAGLQAQFWSLADLEDKHMAEPPLTPKMSQAEKELKLQLWNKALARSRSWLLDS